MNRQLGKALGVFLLLATITLTARAEEKLSGKVVKVTDGDTIHVLTADSNIVKVRFHGIDCPESGQDFGKKAQEFTGEACHNKRVSVLVRGTDRFGRTLGDVILEDGTVLNHSLVGAGLAWWYKEYAGEDEKLKALEEEARAEKRGLWDSSSPMPPWEWRGSSEKLKDVKVAAPTAQKITTFEKKRHNVGTDDNASAPAGAGTPLPVSGSDVPAHNNQGQPTNAQIPGTSPKEASGGSYGGSAAAGAGVAVAGAESMGGHRSSPVPQPPSPSVAVGAVPAQAADLVIIAETGECYHRSNCRTLKSRIPIERSAAIARGYRPCKVCGP